MKLTKLHDPSKGQMRVVGLMSGSGSNLRRIIEFEKQLEVKIGKPPYKVVAIFSDRFNSSAPQIGKDFDVPVVLRDMTGFYSARDKPIRDLTVRAEFDAGTVKALAPFEATVAAYAGYMSIATKPLIEAFLGVNVHPADLSIIEGNKRKYATVHAVKKAILAGEKHIRATTHIIEEMVDYGRILMMSAPLEVRLGKNFNPNDEELVDKVAGENQKRLKEAGDWVIFPKTLLYIAEGMYTRDVNGNLHFYGKPIPNGIKLEGLMFQLFEET